MNAIIYPAYLHQDFERRWATRMAGVKPRQARGGDSDTCTCGDAVALPAIPATREQAPSVDGDARLAAGGRRWTRS